MRPTKQSCGRPCDGQTIDRAASYVTTPPEAAGQRFCFCPLGVGIKCFPIIHPLLVAAGHDETHH